MLNDSEEKQWSFFRLSSDCTADSLSSTGTTVPSKTIKTWPGEQNVINLVFSEIKTSLQGSWSTSWRGARLVMIFVHQENEDMGIWLILVSFLEVVLFCCFKLSHTAFSGSSCRSQASRMKKRRKKKCRRMMRCDQSSRPQIDGVLVVEWWHDHVCGSFSNDVGDNKQRCISAVDYPELLFGSSMPLKQPGCGAKGEWGAAVDEPTPCSSLFKFATPQLVAQFQNQHLEHTLWDPTGHLLCQVVWPQKVGSFKHSAAVARMAKISWNPFCTPSRQKKRTESPSPPKSTKFASKVDHGPLMIALRHGITQRIRLGIGAFSTERGPEI